MIYNCSQINENGIISFNYLYHYDVRTPLPLPLSTNDKIIAPYWADIDIRGTGKIFYRQTSDLNLLAKASHEIRRGMSQNVVVTNLVIVTWYEVGYYFENRDKVHVTMYVASYV